MNFKAVSFGEILWDIFPNYKLIGGAPLNLILRMKSFGHECNIISNIGIFLYKQHKNKDSKCK